MPVVRVNLLKRNIQSLLSASLLALATSAQAASPELTREFAETVTPFVSQYCVACHGGAAPAAKFDITVYPTVDSVVADSGHWAVVMARLDKGDMPPAAMPQPDPALRQKVANWIRALRKEEAEAKAGDPGPVLARRLSNAEYNYTIRDLTGQDLRPTREFPVDPANLAGFDNSGESLTMSPALLNKYLQAAREVAEHMVFKSDTFDFAPHLMLVETDREKYTIQRIIEFYKNSPTDYADYFQAAWRYKHRAALKQPNATLESIAAQQKLSAKYLPMVWGILEGPVKENVGPIAKLREMWNALPAPGNEGTLRTQTERMRDWVMKLRADTAMNFAAPRVRGLSPWSQPLINWKYRNYTTHRRDFDRTALREASQPPEELPAIPPYPGLGRESYDRARALQINARAGNPDLVVPDGQRERYETAFAEFANVFPDVFYVSERGRFFPDDSNDKGRFLSAGFHNVMGYTRDDTPLSELILDEEGQKELEKLWLDFDFVAEYTARTWDQYYFNQSGEVDGLGRESGTERPADAAVDATVTIMAIRDKYLAKAKEDPANAAAATRDPFTRYDAVTENDPIAVEAILSHFQKVDQTLRELERLHLEAEPKHVDALLKFAERAYRRPLTKQEGEDLRAYYRKLRDETGLTHEEAMRDSVISVLMSPDFLYRIDLVDGFSSLLGATPQAAVGKPASGVSAKALSPYALASRLSYFLWSSMPDAELLSHAADGSITRPEVLAAQAKRMLKDPRVRGMAAEFAGNWLEFRRFETFNSVDRQRFPDFDDTLREAMFEEPVRLIEDAVINDRSVLDLVYGNYTFVNPVLARHYGMPQGSGNEAEWVRVDHADRYERGGLLPMAVFLTQNSPGLRTSPVKRGYWVVRRVLGEVIPPPPPVVPELPADEASSDLPLPKMLEQHRANPLCASCHARFDSFGLVFEGYGPVGELRQNDLAGRMVAAVAEFPGDGGKGEGLRGVKDYIKAHREADYLDNLSRKLLAYALSRSLLLSDEPLIEQAQANLAAKDYRFGALVETIVTSPQFMNRRDPDPAEQRSFVPQRGN
jgi:mono/diheme cytochrome c family protein